MTRGRDLVASHVAPPIAGGNAYSDGNSGNWFYVNGSASDASYQNNISYGYNRTASRALNYDPRINAQRAAQIRKLAEQVGYRPKPLPAPLEAYSRIAPVLVLAPRL